MISGEKAGSHSMQGIGAGFVPKGLNTKLIDEVIKIDDDEAFYYGRLLARLEGLLSGISSGAALAATIKIGKRKELINKIRKEMSKGINKEYILKEEDRILINKFINKISNEINSAENN